MWLEVMLRVLHILSAMVLVGGLFFMLCVGTDFGGDESDPNWQIRRRRWSISVMIASAVLLITGLINAARMTMGYHFPETNYHMWLGVKILLALVVMLGASILSGRSAQAQQCRKTRWCAPLVLVLAVATIVVAAYLKESPRVSKAATGTSRILPATNQQ